MNLRSCELRVLGLAYLLAFAGDGLWRALLAAYALHTVGLDAGEVGLLFSAGALPGLLTAFALRYLYRFFALGAVAWAAASLAAGGLALAAVANGLAALLLASMLTSLGMVCFYVVANGICLLDTDRAQAPSTLGRLKSLGPAASVLAALFVLLALDRVGARPAIGLASACVASSAIVLAWFVRGLPASGAVRATGSQRRSRLNFRAELWPYYALNFLAGARSALFKAFVIVFLVREYGLDVKSTASLVLLGHLCSFIGYRLIGRCLERFSRGTVLGVIYALVALCFTGFYLVAVEGIAPQGAALLLEGLFLLDSLVFGASVVTDSYLKSKSVPRELSGHLAAGTSMYALAGVCVPLFGSFAWHGDGVYAVFLAGAALAVCAACLSQWLDRPASAATAARAATA